MSGLPCDCFVFTDCSFNNFSFYLKWRTEKLQNQSCVVPHLDFYVGVQRKIGKCDRIIFFQLFSFFIVVASQLCYTVLSGKSDKENWLKTRYEFPIKYTMVVLRPVLQQGVHSFLETIIIHLNSRYCLPIVDFW